MHKLPMLIIIVTILISLPMSLSKPARKFRLLNCISYNKKTSIPKFQRFLQHLLMVCFELWRIVANMSNIFLSLSSPRYYRQKESWYFEEHENIARWWMFCSFWRGKAGIEKKGVTAPFSGKKGTRRGCPWFFQIQKNNILVFFVAEIFLISFFLDPWKYIHWHDTCGIWRIKVNK